MTTSYSKVQYSKVARAVLLIDYLYINSDISMPECDGGGWARHHKDHSAEHTNTVKNIACRRNILLKVHYWLKLCFNNCKSFLGKSSRKIL